MKFSTSFKKCLKYLYDKKNCRVSERLLMFQQGGGTNGKIDYLALRGDNISFLPNGKPHEVTADGKWSRKGRQDAKPAKVARLILGTEVTDEQIEKFNNNVKAYVSMEGDDDGNGKAQMYFVRVYGELIYYYYSDSSYFEESSGLGGSCMRHEKYQENKAFELYSQNEACSLLVLKNQDNKNVGRALLWEDGENTYMDTIYTINDVMVQKFIDHAIQNGWYYKSNQSRHCHFYDMFGGRPVEAKPISIPIKFDDKWHLPFIDTLYNIVHHNEKYFLMNVIIGKEMEGSEYMKATDTGMPRFFTASAVIGSSVINSYVREWVQKANEYRSGNGIDMLNAQDYLLQEDIPEPAEDDDHEGMVWSDWHGEYIDEDDASYLDYRRPDGSRLDSYVHNDYTRYVDHGSMSDIDVLDEDAVYIDDACYFINDDEICYQCDTGTYALKDDSFYCEDREDWYSENCLVVYKGSEYHIDDTVMDVKGNRIPQKDAIHLSNGSYIHGDDLDDYLEDNPTVSVVEEQTK